MTEEARAWWEATAEYFQDEAEIPVAAHWGPGHAAADVAPPLLDADAVADRDVVELGCGGAQFGVGLAERGAEVVGVDLTTAQLDHARGLVADRGVGEAVDLVQGDVTHLPLAADRFDLAVSAYAFQWVPDLDAAFAEARRVLRPDGRFVFSVPNATYQAIEPETCRVERSTLADPRRVVDHEGIDAPQVLYDHSVGAVHGALRDAGFSVDRLVELGSPDPDDYATDQWEFRPEAMARVPPTYVFAAVPE